MRMASGSGMQWGWAVSGAISTGRAGAFSAFWAAARAKTRASRRELLARRLAPWTPVRATSPAAYSPGMLVSPERLVLTPPQL